MQDTFAPVVEGFQLYVKALNDRGGIGGVPVELTVRDDKLDATRAASEVLELATSIGVNSIWGMSQTRTHLAVYQAAARNKIPAVAMFSGIREVLPPTPLPYAYSAGHEFGTMGAVSGALAAKMINGKGTVICNSIEAPGGVAVCKFMGMTAEKGGLTPQTVLFPPTLTEFGAIAQRMMAMKPSIVVAHIPSGHNAGLTKALRADGYTGPVLMGSNGLNEFELINALQGVSGLDKIQILSRFESPDMDGKHLNALRAAAKKYGKTTPVTTTNVMGWALGIVMEDSLHKCGYPCSGEKLNKVLEHIKVDMGDLMGGPLEFSPTNHYGPSWWRVYQYQPATKKFLAASDWVQAAMPAPPAGK